MLRNPSKNIQNTLIFNFNIISIYPYKTRLTWLKKFLILIIYSMEREGFRIRNVEIERIGSRARLPPSGARAWGQGQARSLMRSRYNMHACLSTCRFYISCLLNSNIFTGEVKYRSVIPTSRNICLVQSSPEIYISPSILPNIVKRKRWSVFLDTLILRTAGRISIFFCIW